MSATPRDVIRDQLAEFISMPKDHPAFAVRAGMILSALTAAGYVVEPGWQDIATAPGDAVEIDIWVTRSSDGHDYSEGGYRQERVVWNSVDEYWEGDCVAVLPQQVSHWRPLPIPPAQEPQPCDAPKCEPPEELRGVDGWHWVQLPFVAVPTPIAWMCNPDNQEREWRMPSAPAFVSGESKTARTWRYLSPALTPTEAAALRAERDAAVAEVARLREALVKIRDAGLAPGVNSGQFTADLCCCVARAALNPEPAP